MTSIREQLAEFSALVQVYFLQNYDRKEWLLAEAETYQYFKERVQAQKVKVAAPPVSVAPMVMPQETAPVPISVPITTPNPPVVVTSPPHVVAAPQAEPKVKQPEEKKKEKSKEFFSLETLPLSQPMDFNDLRVIVAEKFSGIKLFDKPVQIQHPIQKSIPAVVVLAFQESDTHRFFLQQVAKAIDRALTPAELWNAEEIERQQGWDQFLNASELKLIVASAHGMHRFPRLMQAYREVNKGGRIFFGKVPALLLADLSVYLKEPQLKAALWKSLKEQIGS